MMSSLYLQQVFWILVGVILSAGIIRGVYHAIKRILGYSNDMFFGTPEKMIKLGIIDSDSEVQPLSVIRVKLGNATGVFNVHNKMDLYLYAIKTTSGSFLLLDESPDYPLLDGDVKCIYPGGVEEKGVKVQAIRYEYPKGPPQVMVS